MARNGTIPQGTDGPVSLRVGFETARLELARVRLDSEEACVDAARKAAKICAQNLGVERVGFWRFTEDRASLELLTMYLLSEDRYESGRMLRVFDMPTYCGALSQRRAIVASDAQSDPLTRELTDTYLAPLGITSMLDAPVIQAGEVVGVICHEHVGAPRRWTSREIDFAGSVADLAAMVLEQAGRLRAEAELRYLAAERVGAQRLELLAQLAGGIAHDLNNVLTTVELTASALTPDREVVEEARHNLEESARVGGSLAKALLTFSRRRAARDDSSASLDQVVAGMMPILKSLTRGQVDLDVDVGTVPPVAIPPGAVEQILLNLCMNGRDACIARAGGGTVRVRATPAQGAVVLEVSDDGVGMDEATVTRIWEPYFTTKATGTGLGLATVRYLAVEHGGQVDVVTDPGHGATFRVTLPLA